MKAPEQNKKGSTQKTVLINKFGTPIKPYKPRTPYSARNPYSNRRSWEEIQRRNQMLKDDAKWSESDAIIAKIIGLILFIAVIALSIWANGIKGI
jgi:hypothetical protein